MVVLLVVSSCHWVFGQIASALRRWVPGWRFLLADSGMLDREPHVFRQLVKQANLVHWIAGLDTLAPNEIPLARWSLQARPSIASLFHLEGDIESYALYCDATQVHTMSQQSKDLIHASEQLSAVPVEVVPWGVDTSFFTPRGTTMPRREELRVGVFASVVGKNGDRKGLQYLTSSLRAATEHERIPIRLVVSGLGWQEKRHLLRGIRVESHEWASVPRLLELYRSLDVYLVTSTIEGGPMPLLEAMACGIPVISTPVGWAPEVLNTGRGGILVQTGQTSDVVQALKRVWLHPHERLAMGREAREVVVGRWDCRNLGERFAAMYRHVAGSGATGEGSVVFRGRRMDHERQWEEVFAEDYGRAIAAQLRGGQLRVAARMLLGSSHRKKIIFWGIGRVGAATRAFLTARVGDGRLFG